MKRGVVSFAVVVALAVLGWWWAEAMATPPSAPTAGPVANANAAPAVATPAPIAAVDARERQAVVVTPAAGNDAVGEALGGLAITVVWADGSPAPGIRLNVAPTRWQQPFAAVVSDDQGQARVRVPAGKVRVGSDRAASAEVDVQRDGETGRSSSSTAPNSGSRAFACTTNAAGKCSIISARSSWSGHTGSRRHCRSARSRSPSRRWVVARQRPGSR